MLSPIGISDVDPVAEQIPLARFINPKREDLPDIDLDFPHWAQSIVMDRIYKHWPQQSARYQTLSPSSTRVQLRKRVNVWVLLIRISTEDLNLRKLCQDMNKKQKDLPTNY